MNKTGGAMAVATGVIAISLYLASGWRAHEQRRVEGFAPEIHQVGGFAADRWGLPDGGGGGAVAVLDTIYINESDDDYHYGSVTSYNSWTIWVKHDNSAGTIIVTGRMIFDTGVQIPAENTITAAELHFYNDDYTKSKEVGYSRYISIYNGTDWDEVLDDSSYPGDGTWETVEVPAGELEHIAQGEGTTQFNFNVANPLYNYARFWEIGAWDDPPHGNLAAYLIVESEE